jgi:hypothetical protein
MFFWVQFFTVCDFSKGIFYNKIIVFLIFFFAKKEQFGARYIEFLFTYNK